MSKRLISRFSYLLALVGVVLTACCTPAFAGVAKDVAREFVSTAVKSDGDLDGTLPAGVYSVPGVAIAIDDGKELDTGAAGSSSLETMRKLRADDLQPVASVTKMMTMVLVMRAVENHAISLDEELSQIAKRAHDHGLHSVIKAYGNHLKGVTVRCLLRHTSGLGDITSSPDFLKAFAKNQRRRWTLPVLSRLAARAPCMKFTSQFCQQLTPWIELLTDTVKKTNKRRQAELLPLIEEVQTQYSASEKDFDEKATLQAFIELYKDIESDSGGQDDDSNDDDLVKADIQPWETWMYSNTNYLLLGMALEAVNSQSIDEQMQDLFTELEMTDTLYAPSIDETERLGSRFAHGYDPVAWIDADSSNFRSLRASRPAHQVVPREMFSHILPDNRRLPLTDDEQEKGSQEGKRRAHQLSIRERDNTFAYDLSWLGSAGGVVSTPIDLARFMRALFSGQLLKTRSMAAIQEVVPASEEFYGLGLECKKHKKNHLYKDSPALTVWGHAGDIQGHMAGVYYIEGGPLDDTVITMIANSDIPSERDRLFAQTVRSLTKKSDPTVTSRDASSL